MFLPSFFTTKANLFVDRRFGEYDEKMSLEEKMMKRFTMEKKVKKHTAYRNSALYVVELITKL